MGARGPTPPSPERVARILVDAEELGDVRSAERHHISARSVENYRAKYSKLPRVVELCGQLRKQLVDADWYEEAREVRRKLLARVLAMSEGPEATLRDVQGALKIVHDCIVSRELLGESDERADRQRPAPGHHGAASPAPDHGPPS